jgi:inhibitor of cysteine peptidase
MKNKKEDEKQFQEIEKKIIRAAERIDVPAGLEPENMKLRLRRKKMEKKGARRKVYAGIAAAALILMAGTAAFHAVSERGGDMAKEGGQNDMAVLEDKTEEEYIETEENKEERTELEIELSAKNYDQLYAMIKKTKENAVEEYSERGEYRENTESGAAEESAVSEDAAVSKYSGTNTQVSGIDEGDIVKTDGENIYVLNKGQEASEGMGIRIIRAENGEMEEQAYIPNRSEEEYISEFYVFDKKLVVIKTPNIYRETACYDVIELGDGKRTSYGHTTVETYDISDKKNPVMSGKYVQDGYYHSSRRVENILYLFTVFGADTSQDKEKIENYIPSVQGESMECDRIYIPAALETDEYVVASSVDLDRPEETIDKTAVLSSGNNLYVSENSIFLTGSEIGGERVSYDVTKIIKIDYEDGRFSLKAKGQIDGTLLNSFSMNEYEGNLRLVATISRWNGAGEVPLYNEEGEEIDTMNLLYILDEDLKTVGKIENLAFNESIYSARFMGERGFFVTFRETDPLFSVDLSDPEQPKVLDELKMTGFSNYLHFYSDNLLLGIGEEVDPATGNHQGVKLSMFHIGDPGNIEETAKYVLTESAWSPALYEYKSVMIDTEKNIFGFVVQNQSDSEKKCEYVVFSYEDGDFVKKLSHEIKMDTSEYYYYYGDTRGLYIDNTLYIISGNQIEAFRMDSFEKINEYRLNQE